MHVFVTGSTGFIGTGVVPELRKAGHSVVGLTRSDAGAAQLKEQGAEVLRGTIEDVELLQKTAATVDAVIHLAFVHDFAKFAESCAIDRAAITALGNGLVDGKKADGGDRVLVVTSGTMMLDCSNGRIGTENDGPDPNNFLALARGASEGVCRAFAAPDRGGIRASVVRLPPTTHGPGSSGFMGPLVAAALKKGVVPVVGDGTNTWSAGHRDDAAVLYRLALEKGGKPATDHATGAVYHAVAETGVPVRDLAAAVSAELHVPVQAIAADAATDYFGQFAFIGQADNRASSTQTQAQLGWTPTHPTVVEDVPVIAAFQRKQAAAA